MTDEHRARAAEIRTETALRPAMQAKERRRRWRRRSAGTLGFGLAALFVGLTCTFASFSSHDGRCGTIWYGLIAIGIGIGSTVTGGVVFVPKSAEEYAPPW